MPDLGVPRRPRREAASPGRLLLRALLLVALNPLLARPGYWAASAAAALWGLLLGGRLRRRGGVWLVRDLPRWAFGRGGTTIGAVYLTRDAVAPAVLGHEAVHRAQWRRYGLAFLPLYLAAGSDPLRNRYEREAGLVAGGYVGSRMTRRRHGVRGLHVRRHPSRPDHG